MAKLTRNTGARTTLQPVVRGLAVASLALACVACDEAASNMDAPDSGEGDTSQDSASGCADRRQFGDYKQPGDSCWAPPQHYCSQGAGQEITVGCAADGTACCTYGNTCLPCGFIDCSGCLNAIDHDAAVCPAACSAPLSTDPEVCMFPDSTRELCLD